MQFEVIPTTRFEEDVNLLKYNTVECIKATAEEENHWYGAKFEPVLGKLISALV